jgi:predicted nucleotidyltransferase
MNQTQVDAWLDEFVTKLKEGFGDRLVWIGHHGSWARGEPREESDIDCVVVLDRIEDDDLIAFRDIVHSMPDAAKLASGSIMSILELKMTPRLYMVQLFHGRKVLYGSLEGIVDPLTPADLIEDIKTKADDNLHAARHYLLYPHNLPKVVHNLKYHFKRCFYALQSWQFLSTGKFINTKTEILDILNDPIDMEVIRVARDWFKMTDDLTERACYYIELLERWSRGMVRKLENYTNDIGLNLTN